jgi:signal transduction histidine kinase
MADMVASTAAAIEEKLKKIRESAQRTGSGDYSRILDMVVNTNSAITDKLNKIKEWTQKAVSDNSQEKPAQALGSVIDIAV